MEVLQTRMFDYWMWASSTTSRVTTRTFYWTQPLPLCYRKFGDPHHTTRSLMQYLRHKATPQWPFSTTSPGVEAGRKYCEAKEETDRLRRYNPPTTFTGSFLCGRRWSCMRESLGEQRDILPERYDTPIFPVRWVLSKQKTNTSQSNIKFPKVESSNQPILNL